MPARAVIVAAGLSSRLYPLTSETPKALLPIGSESMLGRSIRLLKANGISHIAVVTGFQSERVREAVESEATVIPNPFYRNCNNMGSLMMSRHFAGDEPIAYLHGDLVYSDATLRDFFAAAKSPGGSCLDLLTAFGDVDDEAMKVRTDDGNRLVESNKAIPHAEAAGEWTGIAVIHRPSLVFDAIEKHMMEVSLTDYDTAAFTTIAKSGNEIRCIPANGDPWKEIDTLDDLEDARRSFEAIA